MAVAEQQLQSTALTYELVVPQVGGERMEADCPVLGSLRLLVVPPSTDTSRGGHLCRRLGGLVGRFTRRIRVGHFEN